MSNLRLLIKRNFERFSLSPSPWNTFIRREFWENLFLSPTFPCTRTLLEDVSEIFSPIYLLVNQMVVS